MINWFVFLWLLFHWFCPFGVVCLLLLLHFMYYFVLIWLFKNLIIISFAQWISIFLFSKKEHTYLFLLHSNSEFRFDLVCVCVYDFLLDLQLFNMIHFSIIFHLPSNKYSLKILYFSYFSQQLHSSNFVCPIFMFIFVYSHSRQNQLRLISLVPNGDSDCFRMRHFFATVFKNSKERNFFSHTM